MKAWGRVFFIYDNGRLSSVKAQPLENHVGNCHALLEKFRPDYFHSETRNRLMRATLLHDAGKVHTFRIVQDDITERLSYSFAGHRFHVPGDDAYVDALIRSHHEFSVERINAERSQFQGMEKKRFADDLYLICMADQMEAELAVKTVERSTGDLPRTFMEFTTLRKGDTEFAVTPWPFAEESLKIEFRLLVLETLPRIEPGKSAVALQKTMTDPNTVTIEECVAINLRRDE